MIKSIVLIFALFAPAGAIAQETWTGYKPIEKVEAAYKHVAMTAVLKILTVTLEEKDAGNYEVVDTDSIKKVTDTAKLTSDLRTLQIETCRNQGLKRCPIFRSSYGGTGFVNDGRDFFTCRHMFQNWIGAAAKENSLELGQISPPLRLSNIDKDIVYNSATSAGNLLTFGAINPDVRLGDYQLQGDIDPKNNRRDLLFALSDFVELTSPRDIIEPIYLPVNYHVYKNEQIYLTGFPGRTNLFGGTNLGDTAGRVMVSSTGVVTGFSDLQEIFVSTALATHGMSGGIATTLDGHIVGVVCGGADTTDIKAIESRSLFVDPEGHRVFWNLLKQEQVQ
ncbi:hypothetical protein [Devosia sp.]|uniref:hypothetical protein n=1 Tax=Devosia sp. TaxID=1871048 RepID=UPI003264B0D8